MNSNPNRFGIKALALIAAGAALVNFSARGADRNWTGSTASYTNAANWTGGIVPGAVDNAINDNGTNNVVQINSGDPDWTVGQIRAGNSTGNGAYVQNGQTVTVLGTNYNGSVISEFFTPFRLGIVAADTGVFTMNGGTLNYGTGPFHVGEVGTGILNVNGGSIAGNGVFKVNSGGIAVPNPAVITATAGHGPYLGDYTYFEQGYSAEFPAKGLPPAGSTIVSVTQADHSYTFAPSYTASSNAVILDAAVPSATITLATPTVCTSLSFMGSAGNGPVTNNYTVNYASGAPDTGTLVVPDWFGTGQEVLNVEGRVNGSGLALQYPGPAGGNPVGNAPYLLSVDISLVNTSEVVSIDLTYVGGNGNSFATATLLAVSGQTNGGGAFIPLAINGYNADVVVEATAPSPLVSTNVVDIVNQTAGSINVNNEMWVGNGGNGVYNLSGGTNTVQSWFAIGRSGGDGVYNVSGGVLSKIGGGDFLVGTGYQNPAGGTPSGVINQSGGSIISSSGFLCPENAPATGTFNMQGGTNSFTSWFVIGRAGGTGAMTMSGGLINQTSGGQPAFIVADGGSAVGEVNFSGGTINCNGSEFWVGNGSGTMGTFNMSGSAVLNVGNWIAIGRGGSGTVNLTNGIITKTGGGIFLIGTGGIGTLNQVGGIITNVTSQTYLGDNTSGTWNVSGGSAVLGVLRICQNGGISGTLNLDGGDLTVQEITTGNAGSFSQLNLNGGTIHASADAASFLHDLTQANVGAGGAIIDSAGFNIGIPQSLLNNGGGLTKNGAGILTLSGINSYVGPTIVNAGTLAITTDSSGGGDYTVAGSAGLSLKVQSLNAQLNTANVTFDSPSSTLSVDLGSFGNPSSAPVNASGAVTVNGTVTLNLAHGFPTLGQFPLIKYGTYPGAGSIVIGSVPVGVGLYISNNTVNASIDLVITNVNLPRWEGLAGGDWDIGLTTNWINIGTGFPTTFAQNNVVLFDDSALGTTNVNLTTTVNPNGVTVNNSVLPYNFSGTGKISGSAGLTKQGTGALVIANTGGNNYTGPTVIANGVLSVSSLANGGAASAIGASSASPTNLVLSGGNLTYTGPATSINRGYSVQASNSTITTVGDLTLSGSVTAIATGGFTKSGAGQLTYTSAGSNVLSGTGSTGYIVQEGSVLFDGSAAAQTNLVQGRLGVDSPTGNASVVMTNVTVTTSGNVDLGDVANTSGSITVNSNTTLTVGSWLVFGDGGDSGGTFTLNAGTLSVQSGRILMGGRPGAMSVMNINGGLFNKRGGQFMIADATWNAAGARTGIVNQTAGVIQSTDELWVGNGATGEGIYNMSGGTFNVSNWVAIGRAAGQGTFNLSGGTLTHVSGGQPAFIVGTGAGNNSLTSVGTLNQSGGTLTTLGEFWMGENALDIGTNNISGTAVVNWRNWASIGRRGKGVVNFSGGTITRTGGGSAIVVGDSVGGGGNGFFNQTGGILTSDKELWVGQGGGSTGRYDLVSGTVAVTNWIAIGRGGSASGTLNISGGAMTKAGGSGSRLTLGSGGPGTINQTGGVITNIVADTYIGQSQPGTWNMNSGEAVLSIVRIPSDANVVSALNLNGGTVSVTEITANATGRGTVNFNGGLLVARAGASTNFLNLVATNNVLAGGVRIDSGANILSIPRVLLDGGTGGGLTKLGSGALHLNGVNTYTGLTVVSNGTLGGSGTIAGSVAAVAATTLAPGGAGAIGTLTVGGDVNFAGNLGIEINKSLAQSNDVTSVTGGLTNGGAGTVTVTNLGPVVLAGDKFTLFNQPVVNGASLPVIGGGVTWTNLLAVDGSIVALTSGVSTTPVTLTNSYSGGNLTLTWPADHTGWTLQVQTNTRAIGLSTNWFNVAGSTATNSVTIPTSPADPTVFFRLTYP